MNNTPKTIHYCWFGRKPLPELALKCIASWKKFLPDFEIKEWNEDNFDINLFPYVAQAYKCKKYAFVSDVARFWILYNYGGIYFDTDVEVIKPLDSIFEQSPYMGVETDLKLSDEKSIKNSVNPGIGIAAPKGHPFYKEMLDLYSQLSFEENKKDYALKTVTQYTSEKLLEHGWVPEIGITTKVDDITIFPKDYFCPFSWKTMKMEVTESTYTMHHYASSWLTPKQRLINKNKYVSLFFWLIKRDPISNFKGLIRVIKERRIW